MALVQSNKNLSQIKGSSKISKQQPPVKQSFVSKYLLCCFSHKYKHSKSQIRPSQTSSKSKVQVAKLKPKATKCYTINDQQTEFQMLAFKQIEMPALPESAGMLARSEMYAVENHAAVAPTKVGLESQLDFRLDSDMGVSNTFSVPFFDYCGMLQNRYYPKNTLSASLKLAQLNEKYTRKD